MFHSWILSFIHVVRCAIWYHLHNLKDVKNTDGCFSRFLNCANGTKLRNAPHILQPKLTFFGKTETNTDILFKFSYILMYWHDLQGIYSGHHVNFLFNCLEKYPMNFCIQILYKEWRIKDCDSTSRMHIYMYALIIVLIL